MALNYNMLGFPDPFQLWCINWQTRKLSGILNQIRILEQVRPQQTDDSVQCEWHVEGRINGTSIEALADTGANVNAISENQASKMGLTPVPGSAGKRIRLPSGETCTILGTTNVNFKFIGEPVAHSLPCVIVANLDYKLIIGFNFLCQTKTLSQSKHRIKEYPVPGARRFSLRLLQDDGLSDEGRARIRGRINGKSALVVPDTGSSIMAVSAAYAKRLGLWIKRRRKTDVRFADGSTSSTVGMISAPWQFESANGNVEPQPRWEYKWHVLEGLPVDAVVSINFIKAHDVFGRQDRSILGDELGAEDAEIYGICRVARGSENLNRLADEFFSDMSSSDPFTYNMRVRESARRMEINRRIAELPPGQQTPERGNEQSRREKWDRIHNDYPSGDWSRLRDDYLAGMRIQSQGNTQTQTAAASGHGISLGRKQRFHWPWKLKKWKFP
ncbi:hypothetical protein GGR54DRAFT_243726 [Hypoxylon sp. NC1633]|nr:hypothetical protein GGR54DRAFT_243726 [Hypoxylon sp. NC1633]